MADATTRIMYNPDLATDYDAPSDVHTLALTGVTPSNTDSFIVWGEGPLLAADLVNGVYTLKAKVV